MASSDSNSGTWNSSAVGMIDESLLLEELSGIGEQSLRVSHVAMSLPSMPEPMAKLEDMTPYAPPQLIEAAVFDALAA